MSNQSIENSNFRSIKFKHQFDYANALFEINFNEFWRSTSKLTFNSIHSLLFVIIRSLTLIAILSPIYFVSNIDVTNIDVAEYCFSTSIFVNQKDWFTLRIISGLLGIELKENTLMRYSLFSIDLSAWAYLPSNPPPRSDPLPQFWAFWLSHSDSQIDKFRV